MKSKRKQTQIVALAATEDDMKIVEQLRARLAQKLRGIVGNSDVLRYALSVAAEAEEKSA